MKRFNICGGAVKAVVRFKFVPVILLVFSTLSFTTTVPAAELVVNGGFEVPDLTDLNIFPVGTRAEEKGWTTFYGQNYVGPCTADVWEVECNDDILIPGWSVWWTDTLFIEDPNNPGTFIPNPNPEPGRVEIQNNTLPDRVNPLIPGWNIHRANQNPPLPPLALISYAKFGEQKAELDSHDRIDPLTGDMLRDHNVSIAQELLTCPNQPYLLTYYWRSRTTVPGDNDVRVVVGDTIVRVNTLTADWQKETVHFVSDDTYETVIAFVSIGDGTTQGMSLDGVSVIGPTPDLLGNCPPPPGSCRECIDDPFADVNGDLIHDDLDHHDLGNPISCACNGPDDGSSDDGSSDDGSSDDGVGTSSFGITSSSNDGSSDDGSSDDGSSDDGSSDDGESECGLCSGRGGLATLTLLYDGDDITSHRQSAAKSSVDPDPVASGLPTGANIVVTNEDNGTVLFSGYVMVGELFDFAAAKSMLVEIYDADVLVQTITFHTSCSQPLEYLDTFGGITIWDGSK